MNPFSADNPSDILFNLSTGKAATPVTQNFLLNAMETGGRAMNDFIERCAMDENNFQKPIKKITISTFAQ